MPILRSLPGAPPSRLRFSAVLSLVLLSVVLSGRSAGALETRSLWLDPELGVDALGRGSAEAPLRSLSFAFDRIREGGFEAYELRLRPGEYRGQDRHRLVPSDPLPWSLPEPTSPPAGHGDEPAAIASLRVIGELGEDGARATLIAEDPFTGEGAGVDLFDVELGNEGGQIASFELEGLAFRGGRSACVATVVAPGSTTAGTVAPRMRLRDCRFQDFTGPAVVILGGGERTASSLLIEGCEFERSGGAVLAEVAAGGSLQAEILDSRIASLAGGAFEGLDAAVDVHCEDLAAVSLVLERCRVEDVGVTVLLSSPAAARRATVRARIANSLVLGPAGAARSAVLVIAANALDGWRIELVNNTVYGVPETLLRFEEAAALGPGDLPVAGARLLNNLIVAAPGPDSSRFSDLAGELHGFFSLLANRVPPAWIESDSLPADPRRLDDDAGLVDPANGDFSLASDSPAIDRGERMEDLEPGEFDLVGRCRVAQSRTEFRVDLGAHEAAGVCAEGIPFLRGDCDQAGSLGLADAVRVFTFLFLEGPMPSCPDACDSNDDGALDLSDGVVILGYLFLGSRSLPAPFPEPGFDPIFDGLSLCEPRGFRP